MVRSDRTSSRAYSFMARSDENNKDDYKCIIIIISVIIIIVVIGIIISIEGSIMSHASLTVFLRLYAAPVLLLTSYVETDPLGMHHHHDLDDPRIIIIISLPSSRFL